jgi:hypothetical protein
MMLSVTVVPVPEPGSLILLGAAVIALLVWGRWRARGKARRPADPGPRR